MRFDIFCHIVDHLGDAGVCLRLTRRLSLTHFSSSDHFTSSAKDHIRLFCDQPSLIEKIAGKVMLAELLANHVEILPWESAAQSLTANTLPDVVLETFSCQPPSNYSEQLRALHRPLMINVEYLSAEPWTATAHGLASAPSDPDGDLRYFYYPGFTPNSGGILQGQLPTMDSSLTQVPKSLEQTWCHTRPSSAAKKVCIFTYGGDKLKRLLDQMHASNLALDLLVCDTPSMQTVQEWLGEPFKQAIWRNSLQCIPMPFIPQDDFDWLLLHCDLNFVRGEDSFVRAQWAGQAFVWDIYPQDHDAHLKKLSAFLDLFLKNASPNTQKTILEAMYWEDFCTWSKSLQAMSQHAMMWRQDLIQSQINGDLAIRLRQFILKKLKQG